MGGTSTQQQTQQSTTAPWEAAQPMLQQIMSQIQGQLGNTGVTGGENSALNSIVGNAGTTGQFNPAINQSTWNLLNGGGAMDQAGNVNQAYQQYYNQTNPLASNTNYDPMSTPGLGAQLQATEDKITGDVNGQFAAAGRDMSGYNQKALGSGLSAGMAPILTNQYNQNVQNQQGAANNLYNAGNTRSGILSALQQQYLGNQSAGVNQVGTGLQAQESGPMAQLMAEMQRQGIPMQNLGMLAQMGMGMGALGSQSQGTGSSTSQMSGADQFMKIMQGIGAIIPKGPMSFSFQ